MNIIYRVPGDGNCFFHSLLWTTSEVFRTMEYEDKIDFIMDMRGMLAENFDEFYYKNDWSKFSYTLESLKDELLHQYITTLTIPYIMSYFRFNLNLRYDQGILYFKGIKDSNREIYIRHHGIHYEPQYDIFKGEIVYFTIKED